MKKIILLVMFFELSFNLYINAQWAQMFGPEGANVSSMAMNGTKVYAVCFHNGFYMSTNYGTNWILQNNIFPDDTTKIIMTGNDVMAGNSSGIQISYDDGANWSFSNSGLPSNPKVTCLTKLGTDIFAGTTQGVYRSTNGGANWFPANTGFISTITALATNGSTYIYFTDGHYICASTNNGSTWMHKDSLSYGKFLSLEARGTYVYAGTTQYMYYSGNNGGYWSSNNLYGVDLILAIGTSTILTGANSYIEKSTNNGTYWFSTMNSDIISSFTTDGAHFFAGGYGGVYFSTDTGSTWTKVINGMTNSVVKPVLAFGTHIFADNSLSLYHSTNGGSGWNMVNNNSVLSMINYADTLFISPGSYQKTLKSTDLGATWDTTSQYYINAYLVDGSDIYDGSYGGWSSSVGEYGYIYRSTNGGASWTYVEYCLSDILMMTGFNSNLYAAVSYGVVYSPNGTVWNNVTNNLPITNTYNDLHTMVAATNTDVYDGSQQGLGIYKSSNNGASWFASNNGIPFQQGSSTLYTTINTMFTYNSIIYAGTKVGVYLSTDNGASWVGFNNGFNAAVSVLSFSTDSTWIYAGTEGVGLWKCLIPPLNINRLAKDADHSSIYPNPVSNEATIKYHLADKGQVSIVTYDITGKIISSLVNEEQFPGDHHVIFNSQGLKNGVYFYRFITRNTSECGKAIVIKN